jgi:hypothetical protein
MVMVVAKATWASARIAVRGVRSETKHSVLNGIASCQNQHRDCFPIAPQVTEDLQPTAPRQQEIKDDAIEVLGEGQVIAHLTCGGANHLVPFRLETALQAPQDFAFIFNHQDTRHGCTSRRHCRTAEPER